MSFTSTQQATVFYSKNTDENTVVKFIANKIISSGGAKTFHSKEEASSSLLIQQLFHHGFVERVLVVANLIVVQQDGTVDWEVQKPKFLNEIQRYFQTHDSLWLDMPSDGSQLPGEVYIEQTPNPEVMKFACNYLLFSGLLEFTDQSQACHSPIALALFEQVGVSQLFISENYISITKEEDFAWEEIQYTLRDTLAGLLKNGVKVLDTPLLTTERRQLAPPALPMQGSTQKLQGIEKEISDLLEEHITPAVSMDGGHISLESYEPKSGKVTVRLHGACSGCPSSTVTLKDGIEKLLKRVMPHKVSEVLARV